MTKRLISLLILVAMVLSLLPGTGFGASGASYTTGDWDALRKNWKASICGDDTVDWTDPEIKKIVGVTNSAGITTSGISYNGGRYWLDLEENCSNPGRIFGTTDITVTVGSNVMRNQFVSLTHMAKAYGTKGAVYTYKDSSGKLVRRELYRNRELRDAIFYGLEKGSSFYNRDRWAEQKSSPTATTYYNWWDYAFGAPDEILQTLLVLYPYESTAEANIAEELMATSLDLLDTLRPDNAGQTDENTLSYRRTRLRICGMMGALQEDVRLIEETRDNLVSLLAMNDGGNGVQEDYSYILHDYYAYDCGYGGQNLAERIIGSYYVMAGTAFEPDAPDRHIQMDWILKTFMPVMHNGVAMLQSNGRFPGSGRDHGHYAIVGALQLLGCFEPEDDIQLIQFIREAVVRDTEEETKKLYSALAVSLGNVMLVQRLKECIFEYNMPELGNTYAHMRYRTDRGVQHTENYTVGLAMSSRRIATHESILGCNRYGWYTGDGAIFVYDDKTTISYDQYGMDFNLFANMYRMPGTTEENSTIREPNCEKLPYFPGMTYTSSGWIQDKNKDGLDAGAFVGGAELDGQFIAAAMDFEAYSWSAEESAAEKRKVKNPVVQNNLKQVLTSDLTAKKSYFMFDNEIVCVGSDIDFSTRSNSVYTYVDNRELTEKTKVNGVTTYGTEDIIVDGVTMEKVNAFSPKSFSDPQWVYAGNFGGYVFPKGGNVTLNKTYRESSADGDDTNDDFNKMTLSTTARNGKHSFLELWIDHGSRPVNGSYSYVMLPGMTSEETQGYSKRPDISIVKNTTSLHVVRENTLGITAMVFWKPGTYGNITVDKPMILMVREKDGMYTLVASDPTQELTSGTVTIHSPLYSWDMDSRMTVSGGAETNIQIDFSGSKGASISGEFSLTDSQQLLFDFAEGNSGKNLNMLYGFHNYSDPSNWAVQGIDTDALTIDGGMLTFPMTNRTDSEGNPSEWNTYIQPSDSKDNFAWNSNITDNLNLNFKASNAEILQIRLKLEDVIQYGSSDPCIHLTYLPEGAERWSGSSVLPNEWKETIKLSIPKECMQGGSLEGEYVTLTLDLGDKKIASCGNIRAISFRFAYMREGMATVDYIYLGRKTHSLYFGFGKDGSVPRYAEGAYGGHDFDDNTDPAWATAYSGNAGGYYQSDPVEGIMTLYTGGDDTMAPGAEDSYGICLGTTAVPRAYADAEEDENHPLSYDPSQAEIVEVRFKTHDLTNSEGKMPALQLIAMQETGGVTSENSTAYASFTITDGQWQTVRIPINDSLKAADYLKSLGIRFLHTKSRTAGAFGKIVVDYIYVGQESDAPSNFFVDFTDTDRDQERYLSQTYGNVNLDVGGWIQNSRLAQPVFSSSDGGSMTLNVTSEANRGSLYVQASPSISDCLTLEYDTKNIEVVQFRFKLKNFKAYDVAKATLYFYSTVKSHPLGSDTIRNAGTDVYYLTAEELNGDTYITATFPVSQAVKAAEKITALRLQFAGIESISSAQTGVITVDYIYVGPVTFVPTGSATVTYLDGDGATLATQTVVKGTAASYTGSQPTKTATEESHYIFTGWDKDLSAVSGDMTVTAQFKEEAHSYTDGLCSCGKVGTPPPVEEGTWKLGHSLNLASDISVNLVIPETFLEGFDMTTVYVETELDVYEGNTKTETQKVKILPVARGNFYYFTVEGLTAVQMNDRIRSVLYGTKNGQVFYSPVDDYSIADYAYSQMNKPVSDSLKILCADLLRYGAKAQIFKSYRLDQLADANMTVEQKAYLSDIEAVTFGNTNKVLSDLTNAPILWRGKALNLESKVCLKFVFSMGTYTGDISDLSLRVRYADSSGTENSLTLTDVELYNSEVNYYAFTLDTLLAAELRSVVSVQIYAGETPLSCTLQYSADTYGNGKTGDLLDLCKALFAYSDSAKIYFTS